MGINHPTFAWDDRKILAEYGEVNKAIKKAEALKEEQYVDFSAVKAAVDNVDKKKSKLEQSVVNGYVQAIETAIANLVYKDADYSAVTKAVEKANALNKK